MKQIFTILTSTAELLPLILIGGVVVFNVMIWFHFGWLTCLTINSLSFWILAIFFD